MSRRAKTLIAVGIALGVAVLIPVIHHYQLRAATEAYIAQLKAQGEPMELAQVIPSPVPSEQNGADTFRKAIALLDADQGFLGTNYGIDCMRMVAPGKAMTCFRQPEVYSYDTTNSWEVVTAAVAHNKEPFALLHQIIARPDFDFQINYGQGVADLSFTNFYLAESKRAIQRLETAALCDLHQGNTASAVTNMRAMLAIVKAMRNERLIISELVRIAIASIAVGANWEVLQSTNVTDEQLARLQNDWAGLDFVRGEENALEMERITSGITIAKWRKSNSALFNYIDSWFTLAEPGKEENPLDRAKLEAQIFRWRYWWSYSDELQLSKGYQILLEATRRAETNYSLLSVFHLQENEVNKLDIDTNSAGSLYFSDANKVDLHSLISGSVLSLSRVLDRVLRAEATKQIVTTAIALKRYQLKHGNYPPDLDSLVPEFVSKVPLDPVDGQSLRYRRYPDGTFLLYSVGENGKDDGGNPALEPDVESSNYYWQNPHALDWVWPQPATEAEIRN